MNVAGRRRSRAVAVLVAGIFAAGVAGAADLGRLLPGLEQESIVQRFERRGARAGARTCSSSPSTTRRSRTPGCTGRSRAAATRRRSTACAATAREVIVYDVQFTEQTTARDDNALITAVDRANNVVLATAETDEQGGSNVLGGDEFLREHRRARRARATCPRAAAACCSASSTSTAACRRSPPSSPGALGRPASASSFEKDGAWIDFHGPPGTIDTVSFSDLLAGQGRPGARARADRRRRRGVADAAGRASRRRRATRRCRAPRSRPTRSTPSLRGMPLHGTPRWAGLLIVLALGFLPALVSLRLRPLVAAVVAPAIAFVFLLIAQRAFDHGRILPVAMPLFALALGTVTTISAGYVAERRQRFRVTRRNVELEEAVRERTVELRETQLEVIHRLAQATESRDQETGHAPRAHQPHVRAPRASRWG